MRKLSILVACFNEEGNVEELTNRIRAVMSNEKDYDYEIIFADNDSQDNTQAVLRKLASEDKRVKVVINRKNYGPMRSPKNALRHISGDAVMLIAADLQDPPELIPEFLRKWEEGYKLVYGKKTSSEESKIKYGLRSLFYNIINKFSDTKQYKHVSGMWLNDREAIDVLMQSDEDTEYRYLLPELGYDIAFIEYKQHERKSGKSSYNFKRYFGFAMESLVSTTTAPLRMATVFGLITAIISFCVGLIYFVYKIIYWDQFSVGTAPLVIGIFFFSSVQLIFTGVIGEYIGAILKKVSYRVPVMEKELINFDSKGDSSKNENNSSNTGESRVESNS